MSHIRHYRVLPWATGPLTLLESTAKVPDRQVAKTGKSSIFWLSFFFFFLLSVTVRQASMITAEAITIHLRKNIINHQVLHSPPIARKELVMVGEFQNSHVLVCLLIYAIFLNKTVTSSAGSNEARVDNIIHTMYVRPRPEAQLSMCLLTVKDDGITETGDVHASRKSIT